jgi:hypothetical protein
MEDINSMTEVLSHMDSPGPRRGRGESGLKKEQRAKADQVLEEDVQKVYEYWLLQFRPGRTRVPALDERRRLKVAAAIHDYGLDECLRAIDGCGASDFHMGRNKANKRYDDLELIFRDQDHVERFLSYLPDHGIDGTGGPTW